MSPLAFTTFSRIRKGASRRSDLFFNPAVPKPIFFFTSFRGILLKALMVPMLPPSLQCDDRMPGITDRASLRARPPVKSACGREGFRKKGAVFLNHRISPADPHRPGERIIVLPQPQNPRPRQELPGTPENPPGSILRCSHRYGNGNCRGGRPVNE